MLMLTVTLQSNSESQAWELIVEWRGPPALQRAASLSY